MDPRPNAFRMIYDVLRAYHDATKVYCTLRDKDIVQKHFEDIQKVSFPLLLSSLFRCTNGWS